MKSWPRMVPQKSMVSNVFGSRAFEQYRNDLTLLEAASRNVDGDNVFARLVKHSTAALLNSYARKGLVDDMENARTSSFHLTLYLRFLSSLSSLLSPPFILLKTNKHERRPTITYSFPL
ncbi:hypothetical protein ACJIZ3_010925 [Penstemon smallii]|uniref:Uncharacterized protein n=1 Tax=Penstemon smallii TaxID=265156 RepID=A0ABD3UKV6_9LAMI